MSETVHLDAPSIGQLEKDYICRAIDTGFVSTAGPFVPEFERRFAEYLGMERGVAVQSGTAALHIALHELGIGPGDEVIVPALTFVASVNPIRYVGATPVFADVERTTWTIDPRSIENLITEKTKAVIPVHLYGTPCAMDEIMLIAEKNGLYVIEDATESLGAVYKGRQTGTFGDFGCFSFNGNKIITTGGGGMLVGSDSHKLDHIRFLVNQARDEAQGYFHPEIGFNYRMTNIAAAMGLAQMEKLGNFLQLKQNYNQLYRQLVKEMPVKFQEQPRDGVSACWLTCVTVNGDVAIANLQQELKARGVPTRRIFMPVASFPSFDGFTRDSLSRSEFIHARGICLPSSTRNGDGEIIRACEALREVLS